MRDLSEVRKDINKVDDQMSRLFAERMDLAKEVGEYKKAHDLPVFVPEREAEILEKKRQAFPNRDEEFLKALTEFYQTLMDLSKEEQKRIIGKPLPIGFYGVEGSFTQEAFFQMFGRMTQGISYQTFRSMFEAVRDGSLRYAVVPLENSLTGIIDDVYDLMGEFNFYIIRECSVRIRQNLLGPEGSQISDIRQVYSHPQGFAQSSDFLSAYPDWQLIPYYNTSRSAKLVADSKDKSKACIASEECARLYGLKVLSPDIMDNAENFTRFAAISPNMESSQDADAISLYFTLTHKPGSLYGVLEEFSKHDLNIFRIDSRPIKGKVWEYAFFVDVEGNLQDPDVVEALKGVRSHCLSWHVLGNYKKP